MAEYVMFRPGALVFTLILASSCARPRPDDPVIAVIGSRPLTQSQFDAYVKASAEDSEGTASAELKAALLDQFIEERLLLRAAEEAGIGVDENELQKLGAEAPDAPVRPQRVDPASYLRIRKLMEERILKDIAVTDAEVTAHYEERRAEFRRPEVVDVSQILLDKQDEAEKIREELSKHPERFEALARERSVGPEASGGGHLGSFRRGELPAPFEKEIFGATKGQITPVVRTDFGFHIFRVNAVSRARELGQKEAADAIRVELMQKKSDAAMAKYLAELRTKYAVEVNTEKLNFAYRDRTALSPSGVGVGPEAKNPTVLTQEGADPKRVEREHVQ